MASVLIVGSGGREHAIAWKLSQSKQVKQIFATPGSWAIQNVDKAENVKVNINDFHVSNYVYNYLIDLTVLGETCYLKN